MFAAIAPSYDLNNRIHSFGRDQAWRRAAVDMARVQVGERVLDVACGTGDLTLAFARRMARIDPRASRSPAVLGLDFTFEMLPLAQGKRKKGDILFFRCGDGRSACPSKEIECPLFSSVRFISADATALPLPDASVDVVSIAFGLRNVSDPARAVDEFRRVLRPGGRLIVLEFTVPENPLMRLGYHAYCGWLMPRTAALIARDRSGAYRYLPRSVSTFAGKQAIVDLLAQRGFARVEARSLTFGIAACYRGVNNQQRTVNSEAHKAADE